MGCRENDIIFGQFALNNLINMSEEELYLYQELIAQNDILILSWITRQEECPEKFQKLITKILDYVALLPHHAKAPGFNSSNLATNPTLSDKNSHE